MNIRLFGSSSLGKAASVVVAIAIVVAAFFSYVMYASAAAAVQIDTINGQPYTGHCVAGTITIGGSGTGGQQGGPYSVDIGWGDGSATTTVALGNVNQGAAFTFTAGPHIPIGAEQWRHSFPSSQSTIRTGHESHRGQSMYCSAANRRCHCR
jgi:hypothetical protein